MAAAGDGDRLAGLDAAGHAPQSYERGRSDTLMPRCPCPASPPAPSSPSPPWRRGAAPAQPARPRAASPATEKAVATTIDHLQDDVRAGDCGQGLQPGPGRRPRRSDQQARLEELRLGARRPAQGRLGRRPEAVQGRHHHRPATRRRRTSPPAAAPTSAATPSRSCARATPGRSARSGLSRARGRTGARSTRGSRRSGSAPTTRRCRGTRSTVRSRPSSKRTCASQPSARDLLRAERVAAVVAGAVGDVLDQRLVVAGQRDDALARRRGSGTSSGPPTL